MKDQPPGLSGAGHQWNRLSRWEKITLHQHSLPHHGYSTGSPCKLLLCVLWQLLQLFRCAPRASGTLGMGSHHVLRNLQSALSNCSWPKLEKQTLLGQRESGLHASAMQQNGCIALVYIFDVSDRVSNLFISHIMKSERTRRSLMRRKLTKVEVFSQKGMSVGRRGGEVGEMGLCHFLQEGRYLLSVC